jgi:hypothetical protein
MNLKYLLEVKTSYPRVPTVRLFSEISSAHACSEIGLKWFLFFFCLSAFDLDCLIVGLGCVETDSARRSKTDVRLKTASKSPKKNKYHF